jgi:four helix bundle protein
MNFRTTRIYMRSLELIDFTKETLRRQPPGYGFLADQLRRAAASVPLNFIEGCGRSSAPDRRRFFQIAIGSAHEVAGTLDVMQRFELIDAARCACGHDICDHVIAMLRRFR